MSIVIRAALTSDEDQILALAPRLQEGVAAWRDPELVRRAVVGWVEDALASMGDDGRSVLVADDDGSIRGFIGVSHTKHWTGDVDAYIGELVVSPDSEGIGVGTALIRAAIDWSRDRGFVRVTVDTGAANVRARRIYEGIGFEEEGVKLSIGV